MKGTLITGLGMVSNVGSDVITACAAQRAGLTWRAPLTGYWAFDDGDELEAAIQGAPVPGFTEGFVQTGAWMRLALACMEDLVRYGQLPSHEDTAFWRETALLWVLPELAFERFGWPEPETPRLLEQHCGRLLESLSRLPFKHVPDAFFPQGAAGTAAALQRASRLMVTGAARRVVVLGVDSWLDTLSMGMLIRESRLKTGEQPVGLCPGEAAACVLVEDAEAARRRQASAQSYVLGAALRPAPAPLDEDAPGASRVKLAPAMARSLAEGVEEVLGLAGLPRPFRGDLLVDLNGEDWKARVWGHARTLLAGSVDASRSRQVFPATSFGDVGAASGVAAMCLATRSFVRGYASGEQALSCSISDNGDTAALLVGSPRAGNAKATA
jgi:3-oxoacyl-[acyl-carrier-protein] synthase-1